jgi:outer membrane protein TolC
MKTPAKKNLACLATTAVFAVFLSPTLVAARPGVRLAKIKERTKDLKSGEIDIFAPPAGTKKLLTLKELHQLVDKQGLAMKLAREELRNVDEQVISSRRQFEPKAALSSSYSSTMTVVKETEEMPGSKTRSKSANMSLAINGQIVQGLSYSLSAPSFGRTMTGMIENNFTPNSPQSPLMLAENTSNYSDTSQLSASISANLIKGSYWSEGRFNDRKIEISRLTGRENFRAATIRAHIDAEQVFYDLIQKQIRLRISERALETSKKISDDLKETVEVGEADKISLLRSQQQIANSEIDLNTTRNDYQEAREKLRETLSMNAGEFEGLFPDAREILKIPSPPKMTKDQAIAAGLANRPDLKVQELALEQQSLDTRISGFNRLPNLDLSVSSSRSGTGQGFGQTTDNAWTKGPESVTWSLSTSYQLIGNTDFDTFRKARIALEKARINRDKVLNQVSKEITSSLERVRIAYVRLEHAKSNREISETKVSAEYEKFIVGESDNKNLIESQNEVTQARISELQAYIEVRAALSFLQQAIGAEGR